MSDWIWVQDGMPESEGSSVLAFDEHTSSQFTAFIRRCGCSGCPAHWYYFGGYEKDKEIVNVTHWRYLGPNPKRVSS